LISHSRFTTDSIGHHHCDVKWVNCDITWVNFTMAHS
jgi:hypothetical protein